MICHACGHALDVHEHALVDVMLPVKLVNGSNERKHWRARYGRSVVHRQAVSLAIAMQLRRAGIVRPARQVALDKPRCAPVEMLVPRVMVRITRLAPSGGIDSHDALAASAKHVADAITWELGLVNDRDPRIVWAYQQAPSGKRGLYAARVEVFEMKGAA